MSTLAAARADNFYYPPSWEPSQGSLNKSQGLAPGHLGSRARKLGQGILIIRFEMPFPIWCGGCGKHIDKGVRYNAEKKCVGKYFSTKLWEFSMKCHLCRQLIVVKTDPKNADYIIASGARRKVTEFSAKDAETQELLDAEEKEKLSKDVMYRLEHGQNAQIKATKERPRLTALYEFNMRMKDDYKLSQLARKKMRTVKQDEKKRSAEGALKGFSFPLLPKSQADADTASTYLFGVRRDADQTEALRRLKLKTQSIFDDPLSTKVETKDKDLTNKSEISSNYRKHKDLCRALTKKIEHKISSNSLQVTPDSMDSKSTVTSSQTVTTKRKRKGR